jgi:phosphonate transport system substrate-binding protein
MGRVQELPKQNVARVQSMATALEDLWEQAKLLNREIINIKVRRGHHQGRSGALKMGILSFVTPEEITRRFDPLAEYLSHATGIPVEVSLASDAAQMLKDFEEGKTDLAFLSSLTAFEAQKKNGATLLATALQNGASSFRSVLIARTDQMISRVQDCKGKRFAFGDKRSSASFLIPRAMLAEAGIGLGDLQEYAFLGGHDAVARAVLAGEYDAGGLWESTANQYANKGIAVIKTSMNIPEKTVCASKYLDQKTRDLILQALVALERSNAEHARILRGISQATSGFAAATDESFEGLRALLHKIQETDTPV